MKTRLYSWLNRFCQSSLAAAAFGAVCTALLGVGFTKLATDILENYGYVLFLGLPSFCGFTSAFIYSLPKKRGAAECSGVAILSVILIGALIMCFAIDGAICLVMAAPLGCVCTIPGVLLGRIVADYVRNEHNPFLPLIVLIVTLPALMGFESKLGLTPPLRKVVTSVDIKATPKEIWNLVVAFPPLDDPTEAIFKAGIAYPKNATIKGHGVGAVRYCNFSTGPFVEPIKVWDEPRLLRFSVTHNPSPMKELSFYRNLQPTHTHNFMISRQGQFKLIQLNSQTVRLEGTTWYYHKLWPSGYWGVISDAIIHKIHYRVLNHIKQKAEAHTK